MSYVTRPFSKLISVEGIFTDGDWIESKDQDPSGDIRLIQLADIGVGKFINKSSRFMTEEKAEKLNCTYLKQGDILIARMPDPIGRACIFPGLEQLCVTVVDICVVRPASNEVDSKWLMHLINSSKFHQQILKYVTGTTRQRISRGNLAKLEVEIPPLPEQKRIAAILDKADAIRRKRQQAIQLADEFLRSVFLDIYQSGLKDFEEFSFIDLALKERNSFVNGPFGSNLLTSELTEKGVPVVYIRDIRDRIYRRRSPSHVTIEKAKQLNSCSVFPDDVLIAKVGDPPGTAAIYPASEPEAIVTQDVIRIRCNQDIVLPTFLVALFNSHHGSKLIDRIKVEATRARIGLGDLKKEKIKIPPLAVQTKFHNIYQKLNSFICSQNKSNSLCEEGFSSLSQKAFKGEL